MALAIISLLWRKIFTFKLSFYELCFIGVYYQPLVLIAMIFSLHGFIILELTNVSIFIDNLLYQIEAQFSSLNMNLLLFMA